MVRSCHVRLLDRRSGVLQGSLESVTSDVAPEAATRRRNVFISYSLADEPIAQRLRAAIERVGMKAEDPNTLLRPGDNLLAAVSSAIDRSDVVIVLVSPRSSGSDWVETEAAIAVGRTLSGRGGRVVPVIIGDSEVPFVLRDFKGIRVNNPERIERVAETIAELPLEAAGANDELRKSAEFQRQALSHGQERYEAATLERELRQRRLAAMLTISVAAGVALISVVVIFLGNLDRLAPILSAVAALLASVVGYYFGRESRGHHLREDQGT